MKLLSCLLPGVLVATFSAAAVSAFAQPVGSSAPRTRADVRSDLIEWRAAGYDPLDWVNYPQNAQRAGAIVAERRAARAAGTPMPAR